MIKKKYDIVCFVSNDLSLDRRMIRICNTLSESGLEVLLVGRQHKDSNQLNNYKFDQYRVVCHFETGMFFYLELVFRFRSVLSKLLYHKLMFVDLDTVLTSRLIQKKKALFVLDLHEFFEEVPELQGRVLKRKMWQFIEWICISRCDVVYTVNNSLAEIFSKRYKRQVGVVRNVPHVQNRSTKTYKAPLNTVYLGVLNPGRGLEEIIQAIKKTPSICLTIIGDGPLNMRLREVSEGYDNISFVGALEPELIAAKLENMHIGWNLLDGSSKSYYYSLANKFFDYVHHGIPVVTMDFPEYRAIINQYDCGFLLPDMHESTLDEFLNHLEALTSRKDAIDVYIKNCANVAQENNWAQESLKLLELVKVD